MNYEVVSYFLPSKFIIRYSTFDIFILRRLPYRWPEDW
jgi:hypothetical protein